MAMAAQWMSTLDKMCFIQRTVLLILLVNGTTQATKIVQHPQDRVLLVSSVNESVSFVCKVELAHFGIFWKVNGTSQLPPDSLARVTYSGNISNGVLTFPAHISFNSTFIHCTGRGYGGTVESSRAVLAYQGLLDRPSQIVVTAGVRTITISWRAPFSLDVTGVDPDIWYSVLIYNVTDEPKVLVSYPKCSNITETHCNFTPARPSPCHKYQFSVIPKNGVGNGASSVDVIGYIHKVLCFGELPKYFEIYYESTHQGCPETESVASSDAPSTDNVYVLQSDVQLGDNCNYTVRVVSHNEAGGTNSTGTLSISTTWIVVDVQELNQKRGFDIRCTFQYTLSEKCYVQLVSDVMDGYHEGVYLEGETEASHNFTGLLSGTYIILVHGLRGDSTSCPPLGGPDYITVANVTTSELTSLPSVTHKIGSLSETPSSFLCIEGVGLGVGVGSIMAAAVFIVVIVTIKMVAKWHRKKARSLSHERKLPMEKNVAYETHTPLQHRIVHSGAT